MPMEYTIEVRYLLLFLSLDATMRTYARTYIDLKPENIMMNKDGVVKITDFGLSNLRENSDSDDDDDGRTAGGNRSRMYSMCGTPQYVAPEVLEEKGYYGHTYDVWSCGVILYAMLSGCLPFHGKNKKDLFDMIRSAQLTYPEGMSLDAQDLMSRIFVADMRKRITIDEIKLHPWFKVGFSDYNRRASSSSNEIAYMSAYDKLQKGVISQKEFMQMLAVFQRSTGADIDLGAVALPKSIDDSACTAAASAYNDFSAGMLSITQHQMRRGSLS